MVEQSELSAHGKLKNDVNSPNLESNASGKKPFVEPEISAAVDILEATTFLQIAESGVSNP